MLSYGTRHYCGVMSLRYVMYMARDWDVGDTHEVDATLVVLNIRCGE